MVCGGTKGYIIGFGGRLKGHIRAPKGHSALPLVWGYTHSHTTYSCIFIGSHLEQEFQDVNTGLFSGNVHRCQSWGMRNGVLKNWRIEKWKYLGVKVRSELENRNGRIENRRLRNGRIENWKIRTYKDANVIKYMHWELKIGKLNNGKLKIGKWRNGKLKNGILKNGG